MKVPFVDLRAMHEEVRPALNDAFSDVVDRSSFIGGSYVDAFEKNFAAFCGAQRAVACATGTDAVKLALMSAGVRAGDEVLTVSHTFIASVEAVTMIGAFPVFIDIDGPTYHLSPDRLAEFMEKRCRMGADGCWVDAVTGRRVSAVLPVHLYGMVVDVGPILEIARQYGLVVIEDACQAHGAGYALDGKMGRAGSFGAAAAFSFYPGKNLGAMGEGGAVTTNDEQAAQRMRMWRDHGQSQKYIHLSPDGWNARLDSLQCAILDIKLKKLDEWNARRCQAAQWYAERLAGDERIVLPHVPAGREHVYHLYVVRVPERERLMKDLSSRGVSTGLHYPIPLHMQVAYRDLGYRTGDLPETEAAAAGILSLPMFPHLTEEMVDYVCASLKDVL